MSGINDYGHVPGIGVAGLDEWAKGRVSAWPFPSDDDPNEVGGVAWHAWDDDASVTLRPDGVMIQPPAGTDVRDWLWDLAEEVEY